MKQYEQPIREKLTLLIDNRAHGLSDGRVNSLGYREYKDILVWGKMLYERFGNKSVVLHGICIGSSTGLFALTNKRCPDYFTALVAEGMYATFGESFVNHLKTDKHPVFPYAAETEFYMWAISGANVVTDGPVKRIRLMKKPILFLHSREDIYSTPEKAQMLFDSCSSENKRLEWFEKGDHSRIRINNTKEYDEKIVDFFSGI